MFDWIKESKNISFHFMEDCNDQWTVAKNCWLIFISIFIYNVKTCIFESLTEIFYWEKENIFQKIRSTSKTLSEVSWQ